MYIYHALINALSAHMIHDTYFGPLHLNSPFRAIQIPRLHAIKDYSSQKAQ